MNTEIEKLRKEIELLKRTLQPIGSIQCFATQDVPDCWLPCDGRTLIVKMYPELYQKIGNVFGGEPNKTFCLPDLQGRFIRGWDKEWNLDSGRKFGSTQEDAFQGHGHKFDVAEKIQTDSSGSHRHHVYYKSHDVSSGMFSSYPVYEVSFSSNDEHFASDGSGTTYEGTHNHDVKIPGGFLKIKNPELSSYGIPRVATETRPKNIALLYCIKVK